MNLLVVITRLIFPVFVLCLFCVGCSNKESALPISATAIKPVVVTEPVRYDSDDPAIWINPDNPLNSLIIGTDKASDGSLYVFDLDGNIIEEKTVRNLNQPNNVDVEYGLIIDGKPVDIAVTTERGANKIRIYQLPEMKAIDNGGIDVFEGEAHRAPMGISIYKRSKDGAVFAIISRKNGPSDGYLWQYLLKDDGSGGVTGKKVRSFGLFSGNQEIESIAVDDNLGFVYYSDEQSCVRKYYADPDMPGAGMQLGIISIAGYREDNEGISIYEVTDGTGYILVSDQSANRVHIYKREGEPGNPHEHKEVKVVDVSTKSSDGSEVTNIPLGPKFPVGMFVAMSDNKTFQLYSWADIAGSELELAPKLILNKKVQESINN